MTYLSWGRSRRVASVAAPSNGVPAGRCCLRRWRLSSLSSRRRNSWSSARPPTTLTGVPGTVIAAVVATRWAMASSTMLDATPSPSAARRKTVGAKEARERATSAPPVRARGRALRSALRSAPRPRASCSSAVAGPRPSAARSAQTSPICPAPRPPPPPPTHPPQPPPPPTPRPPPASRAPRTDQSDLSGPTAAALVAEPGTPSVGAPGLSAVNAVGYRSASRHEHPAPFPPKGTEMGCEHIGGNGDLGIPVLAEAKGKRAGAYGIGVDAGRPDANRDEPGETVGAERRNQGNDRGEGELDAVFDGETGEAATLPFDPTVRVIKADPTVCLAEIDREQARLNGCAHEILTLLYKDNLQDACNQSK